MRTSPLMLALCAAISCFAQAGLPDPDRIATPQGLFLSAANKGMAGAGVALPWNMAGVCLNPGLLYSCRNGMTSTALAATAGYGRDSLFDRFILPAGITRFGPRDAVGVTARVASSSFGRTCYDATVTCCRRVWTRGNRNGALDAGLNIRYSYEPWQTFGRDTLFATRSWLDSLGRKLRPDQKTALPLPPDPGKFHEHRVAADIGVFKPEIAPHLDFGMTIETLAAVRWGRERPSVGTDSDTVEVRGDTAVVVSTPAYRNAYEGYGGLVPVRYTVLALGWNWRIGNPAGRFSLSIPLDIKAYGLFDRSATADIAVHWGVQAHLMRDLFLRLGFEHAPGTVHEDARVLSMKNDVAFGASLLPAGLPVVLDVYATYYEWGMTVTVDW